MRRCWRVALMLLLSVAGLASDAAAASDPWEELRMLAVQHNGRHKPFDSFARETLRHMTGSARVGREDPVATVVSIIAEPEPWQARTLIAVPYGPLRAALGMGRKAKRISYNDLVASRKLMRMLPPIVQKQQRDEKITMLEQETLDAFERFVTFSNLIEHKLELAPPPPGAEDPSWRTIADATMYSEAQRSQWQEQWQQMLVAVRSGENPRVADAARALALALRAANPSAHPATWRLRLEVTYNRVAPFRVARLLYALAFLGLLLGVAREQRRIAQAAFVVLSAACVAHVAGLVARVVVGGRPPVSNFYETMLWLPLVGVVVALILERIYRAGWFGMAAACLAAIMLVLADLVPLDSSISPVVAVLRSNLWLTIHVLTIVASYGALALATVLAHMYGVLFLTGVHGSRVTGHESRLTSLDLFLYRTIQVGVVLLAAGIMLGAVWANASWGRYWGWDPKETWALITLLWFLAVLHGRYAGWLRGAGLALATIGGFFLLLMTYYGVSFYLVGLHSYAGGHAKPLPPLLLGYLIVEVVFMAWLGFAAMNRRNPA